jgi:hypothetical protein
MGQIDDGLTTAQALALIRETTAARNLLGYGLLALRRTRFLDTTRDPILTMLSIGTEKTMKMALGLLYVAEKREWPPLGIFKATYGHNLVVMDKALREQIRANLDRATYPAIATPLLDEVEADPLWEPIVAMLDRYGREGRFYNLDALAQVTQREESPEVFWDRVDQAALDSEPDIKQVWTASITDASRMDEFTALLNDRIAQSIDRWWRMVCMAGVQGVLGERGKGWGSDIDPSMVGRQE